MDKKREEVERERGIKRGRVREEQESGEERGD